MSLNNIYKNSKNDFHSKFGHINEFQLIAKTKRIEIK